MIGLVSCSSAKLDRAAPARELYTSTLFRLSLAYAEATCERVYVLSAMHGLVELHRELEPYDFTLRTRAGAEVWAIGVAGELALLHGPRAELLLLAGARYCDPLTRELELRYGFARARMHQPLRGLQIGERLALLGPRAELVAAVGLADVDTAHELAWWEAARDARNHVEREFRREVLGRFVDPNDEEVSID